MSYLSFMSECQQCKELEKRIASFEKLVAESKAVIESQRETIAVLMSDSKDDSDNDSPPPAPSGYLDKVRKKKQGKQFGKKKKKRGAKKGHKGHGRIVSENADEENHLTLERCPDCGGELIEVKKPEKRVQEDLLIKKIVTRIHVHRYECSCCRKEVKAEFDGGFIGPAAKSFTTLMHYHCGVPLNKIREALSWFDFKVSEGSMALWGKKYGEKFSNKYETLKKNLKKSGHVNVDETGWPVDGKNQWLWVFRSPDAVVFRIDKSRSSAVPVEIIGNDYDGVVVSDFFSAYNKVNGKKQKCLVHLLREMRDWGKSAIFEQRALRYCFGLVFMRAKKLLECKPDLQPEIYSAKVEKFLRKFDDFLMNDYSDSDCIRLMKRMRKYKDSLWTFLKADVPCHNNAAELAIRRSVVNRKVSNGNRSDSGARVQEILLSIIATARMHGVNLLKALQNPANFALNTS